MHTGQLWPRQTVEPNEHFAFLIYQDISTDLPDPRTVKEAKQHPDWPQWDTAINSELDSLISRQVFG